MLGERSDQRGLWEANRLYLDHVDKDTFYGLLASYQNGPQRRPSVRRGDGHADSNAMTSSPWPAWPAWAWTKKK